MPISTPSEALKAPEGAQLEVGGRLLRRDGPRLLLADAFAMVSVELAAEAHSPACAEGDLVVVAARRTPEGLSDATVVSVAPRQAAAVGAAGHRSETRRFVEGGLGRRLRQRAGVLAAVRAFFEAHHYLEVETPLLVPSPGLDLHLDAFSTSQPLSFGSGPRRATLITSPEYQMKRLLVGGLPRIFQLARCFRRGEQGSRHNPEFTMLEWYRAQASMESMMDETETLVRSTIGKFAPSALPLLGAPCELDLPFARLTVEEAFERFAGVGAARMRELSLEDEEGFYRALIEQVEPGLATLGLPAFLYHYPASQASLARLAPEDPTVAERFELYVGDLELCNGFGELTDPDEQRRRFESDQARRRALGKTLHPLDEPFLAALAEGMPPAAGNALGLDRLVALALGARHIDEVLAFPLSQL